MTYEERIAELGLVLPKPTKPAAIYRPLVVVNNLVYTSGIVSRLNDGAPVCGKVGGALSIEQGQEAARQVGLQMLGLVRAELGSIDKLKRLVKVFGMVNCFPDFQESASVINGFSKLMVDVFGEEHGLAARSAVGMTLPLNFAVEVEAIFELA